jgi:hypothetical protein
MKEGFLQKEKPSEPTTIPISSFNDISLMS